MLPTVKGVGAQDGGTSTTQFVVAAGRGVGVFARRPDDEGDEIKRENGDLGSSNYCLSLQSADYILYVGA